MISRLIRTGQCPKCGGREFIGHDQYGLYTQCLLCGRLQNLENVAVVLAKAGGVVTNQPDRMKRTKIKL